MLLRHVAEIDICVLSIMCLCINSRRCWVVVLESITGVECLTDCISLSLFDMSYHGVLRTVSASGVLAKNVTVPS